MNKFTRNVALKAFALAVMLSSSSIFAQDDAVESTGRMNIAVLDMAAALFNSERARIVDEDVRAATEVDQQKVRDLAEEAAGLQENLEQNAAVLGEAEQRRIAEDIQELAVQYDYLVQKIEAYVQQKRQEFQQTYAPNLIQAITELVEEENFDVVLRAEATLFHQTTHDITARVTEKLNQQ